MVKPTFTIEDLETRAAPQPAGEDRQRQALEIRETLRDEIGAFVALVRELCISPDVDSVSPPHRNQLGAAAGDLLIAGQAGGWPVWLYALPETVLRVLVIHCWKEVRSRLGDEPRLDGVNFQRLSWPCAELMNADLRAAVMRDSFFEESDLRKTVLFEADLCGAELQGSSLFGAEAEGVRLQDADCQAVNFQYAWLAGANFRGCNLTQARMEKAELGPTDRFSRRIGKALRFGASDLEGADLRMARFNGACAQRANFAATTCTAASFRGTDLRQASFRKAALVNADLTGASLAGSDLEGANLVGANLAQADLRQARRISAEQVKLARNWKQASYDPAFAEKLGLQATPTRIDLLEYLQSQGMFVGKKARKRPKK